MDRGSFSCNHPYGGNLCLSAFTRSDSFYQRVSGRQNLAWFYPDRYGEARYQQNNSIIAIGSGQLKGKGLFNTTIASVKNGNFLSEEQTDFIFAVIGEELGFIGCVIVIILFLLIVYECLMMAARAKTWQED